MHHKSLPFFFLFLLSFLLTGYGQSSLLPQPDKYPMFLSVSGNTGWVWKHRKTLSSLPETYPKGFEVNIGWQTTGKKAWQQFHNYPRWGINALFYHVDGHLYGNALHLTPYMDLFIFRRPKHELYVKIGTGIAFYTKYYHAETNPENTLISLPISASGLFSINYRVMFNKHLSGLFGVNFNHASNAALRQPNLGINMPGIALGVHYTIHPERLQYIRQELPEVKRSWHFNTNISFSTKQSHAEPLNDINYMAYTLSAYASKQLSHKSIVLAGADACYDESLRYTLRNEPDYIARKYPIWRFALVAGYELVLTEKTHIMMQNGFYLYDPYKQDIPVYQRFGFKFSPVKHLYLSYYLKTHLGKADFWEFALGFQL